VTDFLRDSPLAQEWDFTKNGDIDFDTLTVGSGKKAWWVGQCGHSWQAVVRSRKIGSCPICLNKMLLVGFNDLATTNPNLVPQWDSNKNGGLQASEVGAGSINRKFFWRCSKKHSWESTIYERVQGSSCPYCSGQRVIAGVNDLASKRPDLAQQWNFPKNSPLIPTEVHPQSNKKVWWVCGEGHEWKVSVTNRYHGNGCPFCAGQRTIAGINDLKSRNPELYKELHPSKNSTIEVESLSFASHTEVWWQCSQGHEWVSNVKNRFRNKQGCPYCSGNKVLVSWNDLVTTHPHLTAEWDYQLNAGLLPENVSAGSNRMIYWLCKKGHSWMVSPNNRVQKKTNCPQCWGNTWVSKPEQEIFQFLATLGLDAEQSNRTVIGKNQELDLYLADQKFAIEFNGLFWHDEYHKSREAHLDKYEAAKTAGINLIQIWEDDWRDRKPVILRALAHKLGKTSELAKLYPELETVSAQIYARKTRVVEVATAEARTFLSSNHVQGFAAGSYYLGLEDSNGVLRALMVLRKEHNNTLNIIRYATAGSVTGGFTKLLKHVERVYQPSAFITFADHTISDGGLYENNGFVADKELPPDYMYVVKGERKHKFGYRLKKFRDDPTLLWDENLSERELALLNNIPRIWDAGKTRYRKELK